VLTSNGTTASWQPAGGGGLTKFTEAESTAAPNATVYVDSLTASAASTNADVAFVAKGTGATLAQVPTSTTAGGNKRGTYATDWQKSRTAATQVASGTGSTIGGGAENRASNFYSTVAGGSLNLASGDTSTVCGGYNNTSSQNYSFVGAGSQNTASGINSTIGGGFINTASGAYSVVSGGYRSTASSDGGFIGGGAFGTTRGIVSNHVFPACFGPIAFSEGVSQAALLILGRQTTDATATRLTSDTNAASTANQVILPNNSAYYVKGSIIANVTGGGNTKSWDFIATIKRGANAAATSIVGAATLNVQAADAGASTWTVAITADTTNGGLAVTVTGQASTTIRWVAKLESTEVTY
jgi:hypothetical protein